MNGPQRLRIFRTADAARLAGDLFRERFGADFPLPRDGVLSIATPPESWRQYVAVYRWPEGDETLGFCNWIRHGDVYLEGGLCVKESAYRRLPREDFARIRAEGGLGQMMMAQAARELHDCRAWFGYSGDRKAMVMLTRFGYERTRHPHVIVKWFAEMPADARERLVDAIAAIGPF